MVMLGGLWCCSLALICSRKKRFSFSKGSGFEFSFTASCAPPSDPGDMRGLGAKREAAEKSVTGLRGAGTAGAARATAEKGREDDVEGGGDLDLLPSRSESEYGWW
jgi:hypothetical protein